MSLTRTLDATFLNGVANHPEVRPWLGTDGESFADLGVLLALPGAFALQNEHGGFVFTPTNEEGGYEFHTQFLPEGRGRKALAASLEAERMMFENFGARVLHTYVPHDNAAAFGLVRIAGFTRTHEDEANSYWALTRADWQARRDRASPRMNA